MRNFNLLLLFFNTLFYLGAQSACHTEHDSLVYDDKNYQYCDLPEMYLSNYLLDKRGVTKYDQSPIYTVNVKVHVIQYSTADPRNYTEADTMYLREAIESVSHRLANIQPPRIPVQSALLEETDSRIRLNLKSIDFIQDTMRWAEIITVPSPNLSYRILGPTRIRIYGLQGDVGGELNTKFSCIEIQGSNFNDGTYMTSQFTSIRYGNDSTDITVQRNFTNTENWIGSVIVRGGC